MFVPKESIPGNAKIWVYQSDRKLAETEIEKIQTSAKEFIETWTAHSKDLKGSFEIRHNLFLIIMIDENYTQASGCSIDKSIHFIRKVEQDFKIKLFERMNVALRQGNSIVIKKKSEIDSMLAKKEIGEETVIFNNLISTKKELDSNWEIPIQKSWLKAV